MTGKSKKEGHFEKLEGRREGKRNKRPKGRKEDKERNGCQLFHEATLRASWPDGSARATTQMDRNTGLNSEVINSFLQTVTLDRYLHATHSKNIF